ncbi:MAG: radical SAM protein [Gemmataceae bacterium]
MPPRASTGSVRSNDDRICRFRAIAGKGFRIALEVTRRCNIACLHCFVPNERQDPSLASLVELFAPLRQAGCRKLILTGGEPLLRTDLVEIVRAAVEVGIGVDLNSNLVGLTEERVAALVEAGLAEASTSLYGDEAFHDAFVRHAGAYASTLRSCNLLRQHGVDIDFHGPVWAENLSFVEHVYELAERMDASSVTLFKVIGLAGTEAGQLFGATRFGAQAQQFPEPALQELEARVGRLRARGSLPLRTIGFWGSLEGECEQGASILGLTSDLRLSPCLLARRTDPLRRVVQGDTLVEAIAVVRAEVQQGLWRPACEDECPSTVTPSGMVHLGRLPPGSHPHDS